MRNRHPKCPSPLKRLATRASALLRAATSQSRQLLRLRQAKHSGTKKNAELLELWLWAALSELTRELDALEINERKLNKEDAWALKGIRAFIVALIILVHIVQAIKHACGLQIWARVCFAERERSAALNPSLSTPPYLDSS